ncbi:MAG: FAD binding domain-containing protein [Vicinamibacterales bacterium]
MIPRLDRYELLTPGSVREALEMLAGDPSARPFAGGTDLMVLLEAGRLPAGRYVSLWGCDELRGISETPAGVSIGALTTYTDIRRSPALVRDFPLLPIAASETGGVATQNRGTIGGNIANASPAADTPPVLLVYAAEIELQSLDGVRRVPYARFHTAYKETDIHPGEVIARVRLPRAVAPAAERWRDYYRKVGTRRAQAISKICFAGSLLADEGVVRDVRIALGSVAPTVLRAVRTEDAIRGSRLDAATLDRAAETLASELAPIDDLRSTAHYRMRVACNLLREFLSP